VRTISFNMNGVRSACRKGFYEWFGQQDADILCVQELKAHRHQLPDEAKPEGYQHHFHFAQRPGYSGVGLYCRRKPDRVHTGLTGLDGDRWADMDAEGRFIAAEFGKLMVISSYFPSGSSSAERQAVKMSFLEHFLPFIQKLKTPGREIILCGDVNIAHRKIDLKNWRGNQKNSGFLPEERAWMDDFLAAGFVDVFRALYPEREAYTWWSNRGRAREKDVGWRIDYQIATPGIAAKASSAAIHSRLVRFSDHAPLTIDYNHSL